jgi:uncharacterized membrane protein
MRPGCLSLVFALALLLVLPWIFADLLATALTKLQIDSPTAALIVVGIFAGSLVNVPVRRISRTTTLALHPLDVFGLSGMWPRLGRVRTETIVAVNVGGCVIPVALAGYEVARLAPVPGVSGALAVATAVSVGVCYILARPVAGVGIVMRPIVPALVACTLALVMAPDHATPVAFVAGVLGPLVGADLMHLSQVQRIDSGMVSIGGAGTFDGILLTGILALYLA